MGIIQRMIPNGKHILDFNKLTIYARKSREKGAGERDAKTPLLSFLPWTTKHIDQENRIFFWNSCNEIFEVCWGMRYFIAK